MMKRLFLPLLVVTLMASPASAATSKPVATKAAAPPAAPSSGQKMPERLVFFALKPGTSVYASNVGLSQLVNSYTPFKTIVQPHASSRTRFENLRKGTVDLATATASHAYAFTYGVAIAVEPEKKEAYPGARLLLGGNNLYFGWFTRPDTGIKTIPDLKGRKISGLIPGQMTNQVLAEDTMRAFGLDINKDAHLIPMVSTTAASDAIRDMKLDATFGSLGGAKWEELAVRRGAVALPFPPDKLRSLRVIPELIKVRTLPVGHLTGMTEPTPVIGTQNVLVAREDLPDRAAYLIVKAILEHYRELIPVSAEFKEWGKEQAIPADFFIPYHPGAITYFKEQGMWTPALAARQKEMLEKLAKLKKTS